MESKNDDYWRLIDLTRLASGGAPERQWSLLVAQLRTRPLDEILDFGSWVRWRMRDACLPELLLAVRWIYHATGRGEVSGDGWEYFRGWLEAQGRSHYEAVLGNPDVLAALFSDVATFGDGERMEYVASWAYRAATGGQPDPDGYPYAFRPASDSAPEPDEMYSPSVIEHWPEALPAEDLTPDRLAARFPRLHARFGLMECR